ncbi:MAG: hypothetical protein EON57_07990 [Alphaproteobacteria bacterium]|nr:MAG: hypothetical protein EON57_07990 [Alphaproteobacteria bacterium]
MKLDTLAGDDLEVTARYVETGALLLRLVASRLGKDEPGLAISAPQMLDFIADALLDRSEILHRMIEDAGSSPETVA